MDTFFGFVLLAVLAVVGGYVYLLPTIVSAKRKHANRTAICVLNLLLGWTFLGWVVALVWATTANVDRAEQATAQPPPATPPTDRGWPRPAPEAAAPAPAERICPFCAEAVKAAAVVCKHCGRDLPAMPEAPAIAPMSLDEEATSLGIIWSPLVESYMWRREFFKDLGTAIAYAKRNT